jgi:TPR repeat protein
MACGWTCFIEGDRAEESGNFPLARQWFERGVELGEVDCLTRLARMYDLGIGVIADGVVSIRLYKRAWRLGSTLAASNIATIYRDRGRPRLAAQWFRRVAEARDSSGHLELAKLYLTGLGGKRSTSLALRHLAACSGSANLTEGEREEAEALQKSVALSASR